MIHYKLLQINKMNLTAEESKSENSPNIWNCCIC